MKTIAFLLKDKHIKNINSYQDFDHIPITFIYETLSPNYYMVVIKLCYGYANKYFKLKKENFPYFLNEYNEKSWEIIYVDSKICHDN